MPELSIGNLVTFDASVQSVISSLGGAYKVGLSGDGTTFAVGSDDSFAVFTITDGGDVQVRCPKTVVPDIRGLNIGVSFDGDILVIGIGKFIQFRKYNASTSAYDVKSTIDAVSSVAVSGARFTFAEQVRRCIIATTYKIERVVDVNDDGTYTVVPIDAQTSTVEIGDISPDGTKIVTVSRISAEIRLYSYNSQTNRFEFTSKVDTNPYGTFGTGTKVHFNKSGSNVLAFHNPKNAHF